MTTANVVDVSEWQPTSIDWANLKANGVKAVVVRIGHGTTRDTNAADHISNAAKAGLIVHVYHYYEGVDGELQYSVNNAKSLNIKPNVYCFLDMEGTIAGSWPSIFESFRKAWAGYGWNTGLYCSLSNYAKFDDATLTKQGVYRWIAAWGSDQPASADMWQYDSKTGLGSYTSALDKDVDITGKLIKEPDSTVVEPTDPNGNYTVKPGAFVGFDHSTTELQGGEMLVASPDGQNKIPKLAPTGAFLFNNADGDNMWTLIKPKIQMPKLDWSAITNKPDVALKSDLTWSSITDKPDIALKSDLTWSNVAGRPDVDKIASQASQAVVTANTAQSQASAAGQAASSASAQASAAKASANTATATANAAKASASTASATAASAQQVANSASASASATAVALKSKADTATVNAQFTAVNSSVASAQSTADSAVAGLDNKLDKTALTWGNIANKPTNLATSENVAKAQSAANSAVSMASGATATANSAKSAATSAVGVANTANTTANSALSKANSAVSVASQANSNASSAVSIANSANNSASSAVNTANQAKSTADSVNSKVTEIQSNGGGRNLLTGTSGDWITKTASGWMLVTTADSTKTSVADYHTGDSFTYSETVTNKSNSDVRLEMYCCDNNGNRLNGDSHHVLSDFVAPNTNAKRISCTITIDSNTWYVEHTLIADGTSDAKTVQIKGEMFEYGTIAHDWQPAPEDTQTQIDANKTAATNAQNTADSALSKANSNATALNNKANKSDLTWANISGKPSIPDDDATTTVSSGDLNNYTTTGKYYMPNSLANYTNHPTTGTDMGNWFVMKVDSYNGGAMIIQTIYQINSGDVWIRQRWGSSWKSWRQINFWG